MYTIIPFKARLLSGPSVIVTFTLPRSTDNLHYVIFFCYFGCVCLFCGTDLPIYSFPLTIQIWNIQILKLETERKKKKKKKKKSRTISIYNLKGEAIKHPSTSKNVSVHMPERIRSFYSTYLSVASTRKKKNK